MQRNAPDGGIIISCDFCGTDWDPATGLPAMTEGHKGSVLCLDCLQLALPESQPSPTPFDCTLCLQHHPPGARAWSPRGGAASAALSSDPMPPGLNPAATLCWPCIRLAAKTFHKDKDIPFRWDPAQWPKE